MVNNDRHATRKASSMLEIFPIYYSQDNNQDCNLTGTGVWNSGCSIHAMGKNRIPIVGAGMGT